MLTGTKLLLRSAIRRSFSSRAAEADRIRASSIANATAFWGEQAKSIDWIRPPSMILEIGDHGYGKWFQDGQMNTCFNCLDRHIHAGHGGRTALIYDSPVTDTVQKFSYSELFEQVCKAATVLKEMGIKKGDRVVIYMPNIPEAVVAMLACARVGAIHSVVFGGFVAAELAKRIRDCAPKLVIASSCGIEGKKLIDYKALLDEALELSASTHIVPQTLIFQRKELPVQLQSGRDHDWRERMQSVRHPDRSFATLAASDPLYILYTSGTTGAPKGIVRDNGGHAVALHWSMENIYAAPAGAVFWAASDVGWVVGHSYIVYGPLLRGCTSLLYEGKPVGTPDAANFWRTIARHRVHTLFTAPTALRAIKRLDPHGELPRDFDLSSLHAVFLAGEHADHNTILWAEHALHVPILDHWWQTETGWPICANLLNLEGRLSVKAGSTYKPCPGYDVHVLDSASHARVHSPHTSGRLAIRLPLPPGAMLSLYNAPDRFVEAYLSRVPGYYDTGDAGYLDEEGYVYVLSRTDDVLNVAGHRLSSGAMEEVIAEHVHVSEVAVVGVKDSLKGQVPLALVVVNTQCKDTARRVTTEVVELVRQRIGAVAALKRVQVVDRLPKTRSGKVLRGTLRAMADGQDYAVPATIEDPAVLTEIAALLRAYKPDE